MTEKEMQEHACKELLKKVVDSGQIKEHGTHDELLKKHGLYAAMWDAGVNSATWTIRAGKEAVTE